jgi:type I restriction enzyme R subunit
LEEAEREESTLNDAEDGQDEILRVMRARGRQPNISFFAFTATPKPKTLEMFDEPGADGKSPFHLYSMRQAIEEGFILNVLQNYTSYKTYFRLTKEIEDDPQLNKRKTSRAIARFLSLHPYNLAQKVEVIIEHFRQVTMPKIGGKAKAMVVTNSRLHAVRYKQEVDQYLKEQKYTHIRALVAFSGKVRDEFGLEYTEAGMNGFGEKQLPDKFETDEYQLLLVADKYQTGYDQPLLHTMYIDKKLSGLRAVQTLSRLNRTYPGKADTFILDFVNEREEIQAAFQPYYEQMTIDGATDPNQLYDLKHKLDDYQIYAQSEIDNFCRIYFGSKSVQAAREQGLLHGYLDPAASRYRNADDEQQEDFKHLMAAFIRLYSFLSQVMPFQDAELEKMYAYGRLLITKLGGINTSSVYTIGDEVALEYYRLQKIEEGAIALTRDGDTALKTTGDVGTSKKEADELAALSTIINVLNDKFGTDFTPSDKLFFDQIEEDLVADESLAQQARSNTIENFKFGFDELFTGKVIDRMDQNQDIFAKIMDDPDFAGAIKNFLLKKVYERLRS